MTQILKKPGNGLFQLRVVVLIHAVSSNPSIEVTIPLENSIGIAAAFGKCGPNAVPFFRLRGNYSC
jgi:hypothetical protein